MLAGLVGLDLDRESRREDRADLVDHVAGRHDPLAGEQIADGRVLGGGVAQFGQALHPDDPATAGLKLRESAGHRQGQDFDLGHHERGVASAGGDEAAVFHAGLTDPVAVQPVEIEAASHE